MRIEKRAAIASKIKRARERREKKLTMFEDEKEPKAKAPDEQEMKKDALAVPAQERRAVEMMDINPREAKAKLEAIREFQRVVKASLIEGHDYGKIPGTDKPTLLKPGAEKIIKLLNLSDEPEILEKVEDWKNGFFHYAVKMILRDIASGSTISSGIGSCNSRESKYRYRWVPEWNLPAQYASDKMKAKLRFVKRNYRNREGSFKSFRIPNDDIFSLVNTILKMAKKRALIDAALSVGRLSDLFTQDIEDIRDQGIADEAPPREAEDIPDAEYGEYDQTPMQPKEQKKAPAPIASSQQQASDAQKKFIRELRDGLIKLGHDAKKIESGVLEAVNSELEKEPNRSAAKSLDSLSKREAQLAISCMIELRNLSAPKNGSSR